MYCLNKVQAGDKERRLVNPLGDYVPESAIDLQLVPVHVFA